MRAIYKRELSSYFHSMIGYVFMFFVFFIVGIYFRAYNLAYAYPTIAVTLSSVTFLFLIGIPVLTMRVFSEERKQKTDQLLLTAPVSVTKIVCGKYAALGTIYAIPVLVICVYPLILRSFGTISFTQNYTAILGFFLLGLANISIGMFLSSVTENQIVAAVLTFIAMFVCYMIQALESLFTDTSKASFVVAIVIGLLFAGVVFAMTKSKWVALGVAGLFEIAAGVLYGIKASLYEGFITGIMELFNMDGRFRAFVTGTFDLKAILYFLSVIFVFVFLTIQSVNKRRWS